MLESLVNFKEISQNPHLVAVWSFIVCTVGIIISSQIPFAIPGTGSGFLAVLFTIIPSVYFITTLIKREERMEETMAAKHMEGRLWERHELDIVILFFFFLGMTAAFALWSFLLPQGFFQSQISKVNEIQGMGVTGKIASMDTFSRILVNNLQVMMFSFLFSFIFGAGAIFIIVWNASVLGVYIGQLSKAMWHIPIVSLSFLPHGIPEIVGYLLAGLAGGLLSAAIIRKNPSRVLQTIAIDSIKILLLGVVFILIGAGIEAFFV